MFSEDVDMMSKEEVIEAVLTDGFFVKDDFVYVWKRAKINHFSGYDICPFFDNPGAQSICSACLALDSIMPQGEDEAGIGRFEEGDTEAYKKAFRNINQKLTSCK